MDDPRACAHAICIWYSGTAHAIYLKHAKETMMGDRRFRDRFGRSNPFDRSPQRDDADPGDPYSNSGQNGAGRQEQPDQPYRRDRRDTPVYPDLNDNGGYQVDQTGGELLELPAPCGKHMVYYPQALKELAEQRLRFYVFQA